jgi:hypothetical protein
MSRSAYDAERTLVILLDRAFELRDDTPTEGVEGKEMSGEALADLSWK